MTPSEAGSPADPSLVSGSIPAGLFCTVVRAINSGVERLSGATASGGIEAFVDNTSYESE
jgi:hypothetical protein